MLESLSVKLSKYLSPQVYASIFAGSRDMELATERKRLTVFFSDLKDFVATTADMQPEDLTAMLNRYFTAMSKIALAHGAHAELGFGLGVASEHQLATVGGRQMHIDHLHSGKLLQHAARRQPRRQRVQAPRQRDVQAIS